MRKVGTASEGRDRKVRVLLYIMQRTLKRVEVIYEYYRFVGLLFLSLRTIRD